MTDHRSLALVAALSLALALPAVIQEASAQEAGEGALIEEAARGTALVHDVDLTTRQVLLETEDGRFVTLVAPEEIRNLPQVSPGDTLNIAYYGGIAVSLAPEGAEPIPTEGSSSLVRAPEGELPAGAVASELATTVTFDAFDPETGEVLFTGQSGVQRSVDITEPDLIAFVETLEAGDQVDVVFIEILAIAVDPMQ